MRVYIIILSICIGALSGLAMEDKKPRFQELNHDELTELWQGAYYGVELQEGECDVCWVNRKDLVGQVGCAVFGEPHGTCLGCIKAFRASLFLTFKGHSTEHNLKEGLPHICSLAVDAAAEFLATLNDEGLKDILEEFEAKRGRIEELKSLNHICTACSKFKLSDRFVYNNLTSERWWIMCAACGHDYVHSNGCSIIHCPSCAQFGVDITTCVCCYEIKIGGRVAHVDRENTENACSSKCSGRLRDPKNRIPMPHCICSVFYKE